ncbi:glycosyltransferase family 2 protein [Riemerella anatipestifer]|nr:glycosyltransferase family 2 protein [Riemerella anatipestifer]
MTKKLVSIIVPVYNQEEYLGDCFESILLQSYENWECIIIDDGSTDSSRKVALDWQNRDKRFIYFHKENGGVSSARNLGINKSSGEFLCFIDPDDTVNRNYIYDFILNYEGRDTLIFQDINIVNKDFSVKQNVLKYKNRIYDLTDLEYDKDLFIGFSWNKLYEKEIIQNNNILFDERLPYAEDKKFYMQYLYRVKRIKTIDCSNYNYYKRDNSAMTKHKNFHYSVYEIVIDFFSEFVNSGIVSKDSSNFDLVNGYTYYFNLYYNSLLKERYRTAIRSLKKNHSVVDFTLVKQKTKLFKYVTQLYRLKLYCLSFLLWRFFMKK